MSPSLWLRTVGLCALVIVVGALASVWSQEAKPKKYALLVGVTEYDSKNFSPLKYTANDAEKMAEVLKKAGFTVRVLSSKGGEKNAPTAENIRAALKALLAKKTKDDTILVGLAGHGMQLEVTDKKGENPKSYTYFCPKDASLLDVSHATGYSEQLILLDELFDLLGKCDAGHKMALVDACRNDDRIKATKRARLDVNKVTVPDGVGVLFSCGRGQFAFETPELEHGVFFHHVIKGLGGDATDKEGVVTWDSLAGYVKKQVPRYVAKNVGKGAKQIPASAGNQEGESVLAVPGKEEVVEKKADEFENSLKMKLVRVKAGTFTMGSPKEEKDREPFDKGSELQHKVKITKDFYVGVTEVTQKQYRDVMGYNPSYFSTDGTKSDKGKYAFSEPAGGKDKVDKLSKEERDRLPVENVSWEDAKAFLDALNAQAQEKKNKVTYRLPTEAEWEYTCRGGHLISEKKLKADLPFHFKTATASLGSGDANFDARYPYGDGKKADDYLQRTNTVMKNGEANPLGIHDMHGNVLEWCSDWYDADYYGKSPAEDPQGPPDKDGVDRVLRGGSWNDGGRDCRAALRSGVEPGHRARLLGFRVAAVPHK